MGTRVAVCCVVVDDGDSDREVEGVIVPLCSEVETVVVTPTLGRRIDAEIVIVLDERKTTVALGVVMIPLRDSVGDADELELGVAESPRLVALAWFDAVKVVVTVLVCIVRELLGRLEEAARVSDGVAIFDCVAVTWAHTIPAIAIDASFSSCHVALISTSVTIFGLPPEGALENLHIKLFSHEPLR